MVARLYVAGYGEKKKKRKKTEAGISRKEDEHICRAGELVRTASVFKLVKSIN